MFESPPYLSITPSKGVARVSDDGTAAGSGEQSQGWYRYGTRPTSNVMRDDQP